MERDEGRNKDESGGLTEERELVELETEAADSAGSSGKRFLLVALVVAIGVALIHFTPLNQYASNVQKWKDSLQNTGWRGWLTFFLAASALTGMGVPRLFFCTVGAMVFGFRVGSVLALGSALLGSYATFAFARWGGREWAARKIGQNRRLSDLLKHPSLFIVFLSRQLPIAGIVPNLAFALTPVRHGVFLMGSFLGYLPSTLLVAMIGSGIGKVGGPSPLHSMAQITAAMLGLGALSTLLWHVRRKLHGGKRP